jgi:hypothetical protein
MAKFHGVIGYGESVEKAPGVWEDVITERSYYGDIIRNARYLKEAEMGVNNDLSVGNSISIVADAYANEHFFAIRYIQWAGALWTVSMVEVQSPRLLLRLGGVYNGPTAGTPDAPGESPGE